MVPAPVPVTVIGGYLGAGKTTLVNNLLRNAGGLRLAVLVNEFGELPIDRDLIVAEEDGLISLAGGCVCCSYGSDLIEALIEMSKRVPAPDHILIETSGVALPGAVAQALGLVGGVRLDAIVVLADAETVRSRSDDRYLADTIARQLGEADLVLLNKADLVSDDVLAATRSWLAERWPAARVIATTRSAVGADIVLGVGGSARPAAPLRLPTHVTSGYKSVSIVPDSLLDAGRLGAELTAHVAGLVRAKGFLPDGKGGAVSLQVVGSRHEVALAPAVALGASPFGQLVFIGHRDLLDPDEIAAAMAAARA
jgi:G3E family GTPase